MIRLFGLIPLLLGAALVYFGALKGLDTYRFVQAADEVTGEVARFDAVPGSAQVLPVIRLRVAGGADVEVPGTPVDSPDRAVGAPVRMLALPDDSKDARPNDLVALWGAPAFQVVGGLVLVLVGIGILTMERRRPDIQPRVPLLIRLAVLVAAVCVLVVAWRSYTEKVADVTRFPRTRGVVVAEDAGHPRIRIATQDGKGMEVTDPTQAFADHRTGELVTVTYPAGQPEAARIERFEQVWATPTTYGVVGGGLFLLFLLLSGLKRKVAGSAPVRRRWRRDPPPASPADADRSA